MSRVEEFVRGIATIAILEDEDFKRGIYDQIDGRAATHFLISPFLGLLGYNIYKMNEIRFGYIVDGVEADVALFDNGNTLAAFRVLALNEKKRFEDEAEAFVSDASKGIALGKIGAPLLVLTNGMDYRLYTAKADRIELLSAFDLYDLRRADAKTLDLVLALLDRKSLVGAVDRPLFFNELLVKSKVGSLWKTEYVVEALTKVLANPSEYLMNEIAQAIIDVHFDDKENPQLTADLTSDLTTEYETNPFDLADLVVGNGSNSSVLVASPVVERDVFVQTPIEESIEEQVEELVEETVDEPVEPVEPVESVEEPIEDTLVDVDEDVIEDEVEETDAESIEEVVDETVVDEVYSEDASVRAEIRPYGNTVREEVETVVAPVVNSKPAVDSEARARHEETLRRDPLAAWKNLNTPKVTRTESDLDLDDDGEEIELEDTEDTNATQGVDLSSLL